MKMIINEGGFNKVLKSITSISDDLAGSIHAAGMFALSQVNLHGNYNFANSLIDAMGKKHDKARVITWLVFFGKLANTKDKGLVFRKRKDIKPENVEAWLKRADETPYWEHTAQTEAKFSVDYLSMLLAMVTKHKQAVKLAEEGKPVTENNVGILAEIDAIIARHATDNKKASLAKVNTKVSAAVAA